MDRLNGTIEGLLENGSRPTIFNDAGIRESVINYGTDLVRVGAKIIGNVWESSALTKCCIAVPIIVNLATIACVKKPTPRIYAGAAIMLTLALTAIVAHANPAEFAGFSRRASRL